MVKKAIAKLKALASVVPYIVVAKKNLLMNSFFAAQFNYCPPIWIIHSRFRNNQVKMHSSEFLLLDKNKSLNNSYKSRKNTNLVIIHNGLSFLFYRKLYVWENFVSQVIAQISLNQSYLSILTSVELVSQISLSVSQFACLPVSLFSIS